MSNERLQELLRAAMPPVEDERPRDVWPAVEERLDRGPRWSLLDLGLAAAVVVALLLNPEWIWVIAYHL